MAKLFFAIACRSLGPTKGAVGPGWCDVPDGLAQTYIDAGVVGEPPAEPKPTPKAPKAAQSDVADTPVVEKRKVTLPRNSQTLAVWKDFAKLHKIDISGLTSKGAVIAHVKKAMGDQV